MTGTFVLGPVIQANLFSGPELIIVLLIVLLLFGGKKLPELARSMGQAMRSFKDETSKLTRDLETDVEGNTVKAPLQVQSPITGKEPEQPSVEHKA